MFAVSIVETSLFHGHSHWIAQRNWTLFCSLSAFIRAKKKKTRLDIFLFSTLFVRFLFVSFFLFCDADTESIRVFYLENVGMKWDQTSIEHLLNEMMKTNIR